MLPWITHGASFAGELASGPSALHQHFECGLYGDRDPKEGGRDRRLCWIGTCVLGAEEIVELVEQFVGTVTLARRVKGVHRRPVVVAEPGQILGRRDGYFETERCRADMRWTQLVCARHLGQRS